MDDKTRLQHLKDRLRNNNAPFWANQNIAEHILKDDLDAMKREAEKHIRALLDTLLIDVDTDPNSKETPKRVAKMYVDEIMKGRFSPAPVVTAFPNTAERHDNFYMVGPITVRSLCSHHLVPIMGKCVIAVNPTENVIGLSKFNRLVEWVMARPQIQEEATQQIMKEIIHHTKAKQIAIGMIADHLCCQWRGIKDQQSKMLTWAFHGDIENQAAIRQDILHVLNAPAISE